MAHAPFSQGLEGGAEVHGPQAGGKDVRHRPGPGQGVGAGVARCDDDRPGIPGR